MSDLPEENIHEIEAELKSFRALTPQDWGRIRSSLRSQINWQANQRRDINRFALPQLYRSSLAHENRLRATLARCKGL